MLKPSVEPRRYQEAIVNTAASHNTLVVIPTGMGKTLIAELLAAHRLSLYPRSKILVLAPTRPLIKQHQESFERDLDVLETALFTGNVAPEKRAAQWEGARIVFSTPQGLENDILSGRISLEEVSLLVVDEAHRAVKDYAYVFVAEQYLKRAAHPRILGLTASPGSKKEVIEEVCRNLAVEEIEVRSAESPDVQPYIQEIDIHHVTVQMPAEFKGVHKTLQQHYGDLAAQLRDLGEVSGDAFANKSSLLRAQAQLHAAAARGEKSPETYRSMSLVAELLKVEHAVELIETQGVTALKKYFDKLQQEAARGQSKAVQNLVKNVRFKEARVLLDRLDAAAIEHPKLRQVKKICLSETYAKKDVRIIIFTQYRDQATTVKAALDGINVTSKVFVGQAKKGGTGMSQKEQHAMLDEFRNGGFACLIATSVAEEGIDIPAVDLVLFFEPVPSAIRTVQRRGRTGRLDKGKVIMLVTDGTRDQAYRWAAHHKEKRMYRVLESVKKGFRTTTREEPKTLADYGGARIVADHREKASGVLKELVNLNVPLEIAQLDTGDYRLSDRVVVEYKRVPDFVASIIDGRLLSQLRDLRRYERPLIVIEGEEDVYSVRRVHQNAILGMLGAITVSYNIPVLFTRSPKETAALLAVIARKESERGTGEYQAHGAKPLTDDEMLEYIVSSLPGVGAGLAKSLLARFRTVECVVTASAEALAEAEKVGPKKAKAIRDAVTRSYGAG